MSEPPLEVQHVATVDLLPCVGPARVQGHASVLLLSVGDVVEMPPQRVETVGPEAAIGPEPGIDLGERLRANPVEPPLRVPAHLDEARLAQYAQVLGDTRLADAEP